MNYRAAYERVKKSKYSEQYWIGTIEDISDPEFLGRCKVRVFGVFGFKNLSVNSIPTSDLPWAYPDNPKSFSGNNGSGAFSTPRLGTVVKVRFENDIYHPLYTSIEELNPDMLAEAAGDYEGFHSWAWDSEENLKIYYTRNSGLLIDNDSSLININNDNSILIQHKDGSASVELRGGDIDIVTDNNANISTNNNITHNSNYVHVNGARTDVGANPVYSAVLFQPLIALLKQIAAAVDSKLPLSPGVVSGLVQQMENLIKSDTVNVSK